MESQGKVKICSMYISIYTYMYIYMHVQAGARREGTEEERK
jgi:hypothetical protein